MIWHKEQEIPLSDGQWKWTECAGGGLHYIISVQSHLQFCAFHLPNAFIAWIIHLDDPVWFVAFQKRLFPPNPPIRKHLGRSAGICVFTEVDGKMSPQGPGICTPSQTTSIFALAFLCLISSVWYKLKKNSQLSFFPPQIKPKKGSSKPAFVLFFCNEWNVKTHDAHHEPKTTAFHLFIFAINNVCSTGMNNDEKWIYKFVRLYNPLHKYTYCISLVPPPPNTSIFIYSLRLHGHFLSSLKVRL